MSERIRCFWNEVRGVYEISRNSKIIAETTDAKIAMKICMSGEMQVMQDHFIIMAKRFDDLVKAFPPADSGEE